MPNARAARGFSTAVAFSRAGTEDDDAADEHETMDMEEETLEQSWERMQRSLAAGSAQRMDVQMDVRMTDETGAHEPSEAVGLS